LNPDGRDVTGITGRESVPMPSRIEAGWRDRFRRTLAKVRPRRLAFGVDLLMRRADELATREGIPLADARLRVYEFTRWRVARRLEKTGVCVVDPAAGRDAFACDPSLGGLARWLRAAGYQADVMPTEHALAAARAAAVALTTDTDVLARKDALSRALLWIPPGLAPPRQMGLVLRDLGLVARAPRCMACGGPLEAVPKDAVAERIPPRTARWKDDYSVCSRCGRLLWEGTHWERIAARIAAERPAASDPGRP
jgi:uncharacterized protein with PIN domain